MRTVTALLVLMLAAAGCGSGDEAAPEEAAASGGKTVTVELAAEGDSGISGTATLTGQGPQTRVVLELDDPASGPPRPAHIHKGTCAELDPAPAYPLANVEGGTSDTTVDVPLEELEGGRFAVNVHESETEADVYVACGDVAPGEGGSDDADDSGSEPGYGY